jgi:KaiC/GvpD/RAD55 family RecA-like ATPase
MGRSGLGGGVTPLSTGIDALDRRLSGGLDAGSLLAVVAAPTSQSEQLLHKLMAERQSVYITTVRKPEAIRNDLDDGRADRDVRVEYAGARHSMDNEFLKAVTGNRTTTVGSTTGNPALDTVYDVVETVGTEQNVIVDPTNVLEESEQPTAYREVLNRLKSRLLDTGGLGVLHCITEDDPPGLRETTLTIADVVWKLDLTRQHDGFQYQLTIPKNRSGIPILEEISLMIESDIWIDDSRTI